MAATFDHTEYFSDNFRDFIARYPDIKERALEEPRRLLTEAQTRMNAANARMIKAQINKPPGQTTKLPEELEHWRAKLEFLHTESSLKTLEGDLHKYMEFAKSPYNDHIRRFIDDDLSACDTFEKFIYTVNVAHFNDIFDGYPFPCTCDAKPDTFQTCMYFGTDPKQHILIACKGICSRGTKMTIANCEAQYKSRDFIDPYSEFNMDVVPA
jgi:hypothetical protein